MGFAMFLALVCLAVFNLVLLVALTRQPPESHCDRNHSDEPPDEL